MIGGCMANLFTYPLHVMSLRLLLEDDPSRYGFKALVAAYQEEGFAAFYNGVPFGILAMCLETIIREQVPLL